MTRCRLSVVCKLYACKHYVYVLSCSHLWCCVLCGHKAKTVQLISSVDSLRSDTNKGLKMITASISALQDVTERRMDVLESKQKVRMEVTE